MEKIRDAQNPLGSAPVSKLMFKFAIPSIVGMLVGSLYNIVDQLFIGHAVGINGNAATNVAFHLSTCCIALALLFGIGGASNFNLSLGRGEKEKAIHFVGNALFMLMVCGTILWHTNIPEAYDDSLRCIRGKYFGICHELCADYCHWFSLPASNYRWWSFNESRRKSKDDYDQ